MRKKIKRLRVERVEVMTRPEGHFVLTKLDNVRNRFKLPLTEKTELTTSTLVSIVGTCKITIDDGHGKIVLNRIVKPCAVLRGVSNEQERYYVNKDVHLETMHDRIINRYNDLLKGEVK